ncbi:MAG TPA: TSUP family transporter [Burkholderiaceae bacterium]|nr:TSUP family transporter [Burkholderiaceae bacterium]
MELILMTAASLLAGFIDAIVGGGGLVLLPSLFALFPNSPPAALLALSKSAGVCGTSIATIQFSRRVRLNWHALAPAACAGLFGSFLGAWTVTIVPNDVLRTALPFVLLAVLAYTLVKKDLGHQHAPRFGQRGERIAATTAGLLIGFYDGFFGPGVGSFFVFVFVRVLGYDFLHASASAKLMNTATNVAALTLFAIKGLILWKYVAILAVANIVGSLLGTRLALKHGSAFVRVIFILVVSALILKTGYDAYRLH